MEWIEIKRNKDGIASKECLDEIFKHEMFVVRDKCDKFGYDGYFLCQNPDWREEIEKDKSYFIIKSFN